MEWHDWYDAMHDAIRALDEARRAAAIRFQTPGTFAPGTGYRGGGPHGMKPGEWTDEASLALAPADGIVMPVRFSVSFPPSGFTSGKRCRF